jgi:hypothetical protein
LFWIAVRFDCAVWRALAAAAADWAAVGAGGPEFEHPPIIDNVMTPKTQIETSPAFRFFVGV